MDGLNSYKEKKTRDTDITNTGNKGTNNLFKKPDSQIYMVRGTDQEKESSILGSAHGNLRQIYPYLRF